MQVLSAWRLSSGGLPCGLFGSGHGGEGVAKYKMLKIKIKEGQKTRHPLGGASLVCIRETGLVSVVDRPGNILMYPAMAAQGGAKTVKRIGWVLNGVPNSRGSRRITHTHHPFDLDPRPVRVPTHTRGRQGEKQCLTRAKS